MPKIKKATAQKSTLQEVWPPKWFFSYSDIATLMMTFFIILSTMLTLKIPLTALQSEKVMRAVSPEEIKRMEKFRAIDEKQKKILKEIEELDPEQIKMIIDLEKLKELAEEIRKYIREKDLEEFIVVEERKWDIRVLTLAPFLFDKGRHTVREKAMPLLDSIGEFLKRYPSHVTIEGYTDNTPIRTPQFHSNWELSVTRANGVMNYLVNTHNLSLENIEAVGYGEYRPLVPNDSEENKTKNRRVVIEIRPLTSPSS